MAETLIWVGQASQNTWYGDNPGVTPQPRWTNDVTQPDKFWIPYAKALFTELPTRPFVVAETINVAGRVAVSEIEFDYFSLTPTTLNGGTISDYRAGEIGVAGGLVLSGTWDGVINSTVEATELIKRGSGTVTLSKHAGSQSITVEDGTLQIIGNPLVADTLDVWSGATFTNGGGLLQFKGETRLFEGGTIVADIGLYRDAWLGGTVDGNLFLGINVSPTLASTLYIGDPNDEGDIGKLTVTGELYTAIGYTLRFDIGETQNDLLDVGGNFELGGFTFDLVLKTPLETGYLKGPIVLATASSFTANDDFDVKVTGQESGHGFVVGELASDPGKLTFIGLDDGRLDQSQATGATTVFINGNGTADVHGGLFGSVGRTFNVTTFWGTAFDDNFLADHDNLSPLTILGGGGDDSIVGGGEDGDFWGGDDDDLILGEAGNDELHGGNGDDTLRGGADNDSLTGGPGADILDGGDGIDRVYYNTAEALFVSLESPELNTGEAAGDTFIDIEEVSGGTGDDTIFADGGDNLLLGSDGNDLLYGLGGQDVLQGHGGDDQLWGGAGADFLYGGADNDVLDGGEGGGDQLDGGTGDDIFFVDFGEQVYEVAGGGTDKVLARTSYTLGNGVEVEFLETTGASNRTPLSLTGNTLAQTITGNAGANTLDDGGGAGVDTLRGLGGNDTYRIGNSKAIVEEVAGGGVDTVIASVSYVLAAGVDVELLIASPTGGTTPMSLTGNTLKQTIIGNHGNNTISDGGGAGADTLQGLDGNDTYRIANSDTVVVEAELQGTDRVIAAVDYVLKAGVSVETMMTVDSAATTAINLTGNEWAQTITGNAGANVLDDSGGSTDLLGGSYTDTLRGLGGNDTYVIHNSSAVIVEAAGQGSDVVMTLVDYTLKAGVEVEHLRTNLDAGTTPLRLTGNAFAQTITGNAGANTLNDGSSLAADTLSGLGGNDVYVIHNAGAVIVEAVGQGSDSVLTSVSYALKAGVEVEALGTTSSAGTGAINLTGNAFAQKITGNAGANTLNDGSGAAADTLSGLDGNDIYVIHNAGAVIVEAGGKGTDSVLSSVSFVLQNGISVETLGTTNSAGTGAIDLTGNSIGQTVRGNAGSNVIDGKGGADTLTGFGGKDFFVFSSAIGASSDTVTDFNVADDTIRLENAIFTKLATTGALGSTLFRSNSTGTAVDGNDYVLYNNTDGKLYYDADGSGSGTKIHFATLIGAPAITNADFVVI